MISHGCQWKSLQKFNKHALLQLDFVIVDHVDHIKLTKDGSKPPHGSTKAALPMERSVSYGSTLRISHNEVAMSRPCGALFKNLPACNSQ